MDEFNDLDKELLRLKEQIAAHDESARQLKYSPETDYWKRRLDEEKILLNKRLAAREEEKKALEAKLAQQQVQIDRYNRNVAELEEKFERDAKLWEERLRAKELDLIIEKNRVLSEEKVTKIEFENKRLMEELNAMTAKASELKSEQIEDKKKFSEYFTQEREVYVEKIQARLKQIEILETRIKELEAAAAARNQEIEKEKGEFSRRLSSADELAKTLLKQKEAAEKEKAAVDAAVIQMKQRADDEKLRLESEFARANRNFLQALRQGLGPLAGTARAVSEGWPARSAWKFFKEIVQNLENETDAFAAGTHEDMSFSRPFPIAVLLSDAELFTIEKAVPESKAELQRVEAKDIVKSVTALKSRAVIVSPAHIAAARNVRRKLPFVPVIVFGGVKPKAAKRLLAQGFTVITPPCSDEEIAENVITTAYHSAALPEFWGQVILQRPRLHTIAAWALAGLVLAAGLTAAVRYSPLARINAPKAASFATPYTQPTNLAFDGKNLWACDWLGQSVYKHSINGNLGLERIFFFPGKHFSALAWAGGNLWSVDPWEKKIYKHNLDDALSVTATYPAPNAAPSGLAGSDTALWSCDSASAQIYTHALDGSLAVLSAAPSPGPSPSGLYYDGANLWSTDSKVNRIYRHRMDEGLTVEATYLPPDSGRKGYNVSGIAGNGTIIWVCSEKAGRIYQYPLDTLVKVK